MQIPSLLDLTQTGTNEPALVDVKFYLIGELGAHVGLDPKTIRYYERVGLLSPVRHGKFRIYTTSDVARLQTIMKLRGFGFSISCIRDIIRDGST